MSDGDAPAAGGGASNVTIEIVVPVAIGVLGTLFVTAVVVLLVVCRRRYCSKTVSLSEYMSQSYLENSVNLVDDMESSHQADDVELDDVGMLSCDLNAILEDEAWVNDATGVAPHCLAILKVVHQLTERLVSATLQTSEQLESPETGVQLVSVARRIGPRVDDVVHALYPPFDPRLLEARCSALVLSVNHLVLLTKNAGKLTVLIDWVDQSLADVEDHLQVLRLASIAYEQSIQNQNPAACETSRD